MLHQHNPWYARRDGARVGSIHLLDRQNFLAFDRPIGSMPSHDLKGTTRPAFDKPVSILSPLPPTGNAGVPASPTAVAESQQATSIDRVNQESA